MNLSRTNFHAWAPYGSLSAEGENIINTSMTVLVERSIRAKANSKLRSTGDISLISNRRCLSYDGTIYFLSNSSLDTTGSLSITGDLRIDAESLSLKATNSISITEKCRSASESSVEIGNRYAGGLSLPYDLLVKLTTQSLTIVSQNGSITTQHLMTSDNAPRVVIFVANSSAGSVVINASTTFRELVVYTNHLEILQDISTSDGNMLLDFGTGELVIERGRHIKSAGNMDFVGLLAIKVGQNTTFESIRTLSISVPINMNILGGSLVLKGYTVNCSNILSNAALDVLAAYIAFGEECSINSETTTVRVKPLCPSGSQHCTMVIGLTSIASKEPSFELSSDELNLITASSLILGDFDGSDNVRYVQKLSSTIYLVEIISA
jgi:hypothetical protein